MTNWLESEEKKKEEDALIEKLNDEKWSSLYNNLTSFFDLCKRLNTLRNSEALRIVYTSITGICYWYTIRFKDDYGDGDHIFYERVISFNYKENPERFELDVYLQEQHSHSYLTFPYKLFNAHRRYLYRKKIDIEDIINWDEEKRLHIIKWLLGELDKGIPSGNDYNMDGYLHWLNVPTESLPGKSNANPVFDYKTELDKLDKAIVLVKNTIVELNRWQMFRSDSEKRDQISRQEEKIIKIKLEILNLGKHILP